MVRVKEEHLQMLMDWRMSPSITKYMNTDPKLTLEGQKKWLQSLENDPTRNNWVIYVDDKPVGSINLSNIDYVNSRTDWGYYIADTGARSLELAMLIEWGLYDYVFGTLKLNRLYNEVFAENENVAKLHLLCGSKQEGVLRSHVKKNNNYYDIIVISILSQEWDEIKNKVPWQKIDFE